MATGTLGTTARKTHHQVMHYLCKQILYSDGNGAVVTVGIIPGDSVVVRGGVAVTTVFNAGTTNTINVGTVADDDGFASVLSLGTVALVAFDDIATSNDFYVTADTTIIATLALTGTTPTTGVAFVWVEYMPILS